MKKKKSRFRISVTNCPSQGPVHSTDKSIRQEVSKGWGKRPFSRGKLQKNNPVVVLTYNFQTMGQFGQIKPINKYIQKVILVNQQPVKGAK